MATSVNPGTLRHRVTPQSKLESVSRGVRSEAEWLNHPSRWAAIKKLVGRELEYARQIVQDATHEITMRYTNSINTKMRLEYAGRFFQIQHIADAEERRVMMTLICTERTT